MECKLRRELLGGNIEPQIVFMPQFRDIRTIFKLLVKSRSALCRERVQLDACRFVDTFMKVLHDFAVSFLVVCVTGCFDIVRGQDDIDVVTAERSDVRGHSLRFKLHDYQSISEFVAFNLEVTKLGNRENKLTNNKITKTKKQTRKSLYCLVFSTKQSKLYIENPNTNLITTTQKQCSIYLNFYGFIS